MPNPPKYRPLPLLLALLLLCTSTGFSMDLHYCRGQLQSVGIFQKAQNCHERAAKNPACKYHRAAASTQSGLDKKDCCENHTLDVDADLEPLNATADLVVDLPAKHFTQPALSTSRTSFVVSKTLLAFPHNRPPPLRRCRAIFPPSFLL